MCAKPFHPACAAVLSIALLALPAVRLFADEPAFRPIGLPAVDSTMAVFSRYPGLLPLSARTPVAGEWYLLPQIELSSNMINGMTNDGFTKTVFSFMDYETLSLSLPVLVGLGQGWSIGGQLKFVRLWGGFMDPLIETFHGWFNFPNNAREQLPDNRVCIDLDTANGYSYHLNEARWLAADPVFVLGYSPWQAADGALQLIGQLSLPLSRGAGITGSPLPVLGLGLYGDWWPANWLGIHSAAGVILPAEALQARGPLPMYQARLALIGNFGGDVLPFVEFTFQSSPIQSGLMDAAGDYFARPNSDLYFGIVIAGPDARKAGNFGAVTIQEDPFTHNSADVSFQGTGAFSIKP